MPARASPLAEIEGVVEEIRSGKGKKAYYIFGEEEYLVSLAREKIVAALKARLGDVAEVISLPGSKEDIPSIISELFSKSLFSSVKIVIVPDFTAPAKRKARTAEALKELAARISKGLDKATFCVLATAGAEDGASDFAKSLKRARILRFGKMRSYMGMDVSRDPLYAFAREVLAARSKSISREAFLMLKDDVGTDLRAFVNELDKLCLFVGDKSRIDSKDIEQISSHTRQQAAFELADAVARKDVERAWSTLDNLLQEGLPALVIVQNLGNQLRYLLQAKIILSKYLDEERIKTMRYYTFREEVLGELSALVGKFGPGSANVLTRAPFFVFKCLQLCTNFTQDQLAQGLAKVSETDAALKLSLAPRHELLRNLILSLTEQLG